MVSRTYSDSVEFRPNFGTESRSEIPWEFWNVVLEKDWGRSVGPIVW